MAATKQIAAASADEPLLEVVGANKSFGATKALQNVSLKVNRGEIVALLGENGAGKSTLIKLLARVYSSDSGSAVIEGTDLFGSARSAAIAFIHQDLGLIEWMTVAENICLGLGYPRKRGLIDWAGVERRAVAALKMIGVEIDPHARIQMLDRTEKSLVAIARALATNACLIVLDEPTASLPADDVARLFASLERLKQQGVAMIYVSHRLDEVFEIADRMVVMRDGRVVADCFVADTTPEETIIWIVGQEPSKVLSRPSEHLGAPRLVMKDFQVGAVAPMSAEFFRGEVVGLVGLRGAGQEAVGRGLFGLTGGWNGEVQLDGRTLNITSPQQAIAEGVLLICGDRLGGSVVPTMSIRENLFLNPGAANLRPWSYLSPHHEDSLAHQKGERLQLRPNDPSAAIESLSGGNQQKVIVGRWLHLQGRVYLIEDPTAGVDVGAKAEIYNLFNEVVEQGGCIIVISTDFEEIANICHRAIVFDRQRVVAELHGADLTVGSLLASASARVASDPSTRNLAGR
jgi:ribose transport system ATP-binding protein